MSKDEKPSLYEGWAHLRFAVVGPLLASPPLRGELQCELRRLSLQRWTHPTTGEPVCFGESTIERWFYQAKNAGADPVRRLRQKPRKDKGLQPSMGQMLRDLLREQYVAHRAWSYQLHYDNLEAQVAEKPEAGPLPSYSTVLRYMTGTGLAKRKRLSSARTEAVRRASERLDEREVRSYEASHVNGLWHLDFHSGSLRVLLPTGEWVVAHCMGVVDDRSRLCCHLQWYLDETAQSLVHALSQAMQKRLLPRALLTDNGSAMVAGETTQGLARLGVTHETTLPHSPYQNGKQESFWTQVEGRLLAMLEDCPALTLHMLNDATQAWVEMEYNRKIHDETGEAPLTRYLAGPDVGRPAPGSDALRLAFGLEEGRTQRRSDGTLVISGRRFEVPGRYRHLQRLTVRYARWDLGTVHLMCKDTGNVLCRLYPQDKAQNADGLRRTLSPPPAGKLETPTRPTGVAPLLRRYLAEYAATGLPPAWLPPEPPTPEGSEVDDGGEV